MGMFVHAILKIVLGDHTAKNIYGNVNNAKTFTLGTIVNVSDGRVLGGGRMNNTITNTTANTITNTKTNTVLGREQLNPQLAECVVGEVRCVHHQGIAEQAPEDWL